MSEEQQDIENDEETSSNKIKKIIVISIVAIFILVIAVFVYYVASQKSAIGQVKDFDEAVNKKDYKILAETLSTNSHGVSREDMKYFVDYINKGNNKKKFDDEIEQVKKGIKSDKPSGYDLGKITDNNGKTIIEVRQNGKKMLFLDKITLKPNLVNVYVKGEDNEVEYNYLSGDKEMNVLSPEQKETEIGSFFVGDFDLETTKIFKDSLASDSDVDGQLHVNTDNVSKNGKIYASEKFEEASFNVKLKNAEKLSDSKSLYIDGNKITYEKDKTYGKFAAFESIILSAKGKIGDDDIETDSVEVEANEDNKPQTITLTFDKNTIDEHVKEEKKIQDEAEKFMEEYTEDLTKAYKDGQFAHVSNYFEPKSDLADYIEDKVKTKNKSKYSKPTFKEYKRDGKSITIVLEKTDKHKNKITSQYKLKYNEDAIFKYKIDEYTDI